jgi:glycosyltransferase involved in cell wall biosynthesis
MNILWIANNIVPELAEYTGLPTSASGSWLVDLSQKLSEYSGINLAIAAVSGTEYKKIVINKITYYIIPGNGKNMLFYTKKYEKLWRDINNDFKPDIVHLHGTEYSHGLSFLRSNPEVKAVVSVQGIISKIKECCFDGLPKMFSIRYNTLKEILKLNGNYCKYLLYKKNSRYEKEIFSRVHYANVVNTWDESTAKEYNENIKCFRLEYNLRDEFYASQKWDINKINRHQIFTNPGGVPIKGLHILCKALYFVKKKYPDVMLIVPGMSIGGGKLAVNSGYSKYIRDIIKKYNLEENIYFAGRLSGDEMRQYMLQSHISVIPSAIEGTSLVLRENMFLGVPVIASFRGGMADFVRDKESGFLYDFNEYPYLAHRIIEIFENDELALKFSENAIAQAETAHDRSKNVEDFVNMYKYIYNE